MLTNDERCERWQLMDETVGLNGFEELPQRGSRHSDEFREKVVRKNLPVARSQCQRGPDLNGAIANCHVELPSPDRARVARARRTCSGNSPIAPCPCCTSGAN